MSMIATLSRAEPLYLWPLALSHAPGLAATVSVYFMIVPDNGIGETVVTSMNF